MVAGITATILAVGLGTQATIVAQAAETTTYTTIPTNPNIAAQKTEQGKVINELLIDGDEIYTGYGDYNANTGPISGTSTNLKTNKITDYVSYPTEVN